METGLEGKRVLVTGASGGIGSACARAFAGERARLFLHCHRGIERAEALSVELDGAPYAAADLGREEEVERLVAAATDVLGGLDVCAAVPANGLKRTSRSGSCPWSAGSRRCART